MSNIVGELKMRVILDWQGCDQESIATSMVNILDSIVEVEVSWELKEVFANKNPFYFCKGSKSVAQVPSNVLLLGTGNFGKWQRQP